MLNSIQRLFRNHAFKQGRWNRRLTESALYAASVQPGDKERLHYLTLLRATRPSRSEFHELLETWIPKGRSATALKLKAHIASLYQSGGDDDRAVELLATFPKNRLHLLSGYPFLLDLYPEHTRLTAREKSLFNLASQFVSKVESVESWIDGGAIQSVAVVGNSPAGQGSGYGHEIDTADCVIRFNNVVSNCDYSADYGKKTDLWVVSPGFNLDAYAAENSNIIPSKRIAISGYEPYHRRNFYWQKLARGNYEKYLYFSVATWHRLVNLLDAPPTAGLLCLKCLMELEVDVKHYGFSTAHNSGEINHYADKHKRSSRHNWQAEASILSQI